MNGLLTDRQHSLFANRKLFYSILSKTLMQSTQASRAPVPSRANQASRVWTVRYRPEHPKRQVYGRSAWFYMRCVFACKMIKANRSPEASFHSETTPQRPCANKTLEPSKSSIFFATMRGLANFTDALSPKDSEFLCTFLLTNRIFLDSSVGRAPDC